MHHIIETITHLVFLMMEKYYTKQCLCVSVHMKDYKKNKAINYIA